ncbi:ABC transporter permease [bacterium]|nr:ABC transporter permease [candidate division CSSED10-310 bacterium]
MKRRPWPLSRIVLAGAVPVTAGAAVLLTGTAVFTFGPAGVLAVPVKAGFALISMLCLLAAALEDPRHRTRNALLAFCNALGAVLLFAALGRSLDMAGIATQSLSLAAPVALGAMAGLLCERTGVINIAIEGMMLTGACLGYVAALLTGNTWLGVPAAMLAGLLMAGLHALLTIGFKTDQIISGTVVNILAVGITGYIRRSFLLTAGRQFPGLLPVIRVPLLHKVPVFGQVIFTQRPIVLATIVMLIGLQLALFKTRWGLRSRACGEHPLAAATVGIRVVARRTVNVLLGGAVAGLGGAWFSLETTGSFENLMTNGKGFIALAAMIFGRWTPVGAASGALLFGFSDALQIKLQVLGVHIPYQFLGMLPYLVTMVVLAGFMGRARPPAAVGKPFPER